jgi:hypothetical protein
VSIPNAPWQAKVGLIALSQILLTFGQYILWQINAGPAWNLAAMAFQAAQGGLVAYGPSIYGRVGAAVKKAQPASGGGVP